MKKLLQLVNKLITTGQWLILSFKLHKRFKVNGVNDRGRGKQPWGDMCEEGLGWMPHWSSLLSLSTSSSFIFLKYLIYFPHLSRDQTCNVLHTSYCSINSKYLQIMPSRLAVSLQLSSSLSAILTFCWLFIFKYSIELHSISVSS